MNRDQLIKHFVEYVDSGKDNTTNYDKTEKTLRIMTFNVHQWSDYKHIPNITEVKNLISKSNPDIIGLNEAVSFSKSPTDIYNTHFLDTEYKYFSLCNTEKFKQGINVILSKYPIISSEVVCLGQDPINKENRYVIYAIILINNNIVNIALTHLDVYDESEQTR